ncbi:MAG: hypothetical protein ACXU86_03965 [Archangium sp.]
MSSVEAPTVAEVNFIFTAIRDMHDFPPGDEELGPMSRRAAIQYFDLLVGGYSLSLFGAFLNEVLARHLKSGGWLSGERVFASRAWRLRSVDGTVPS